VRVRPVVLGAPTGDNPCMALDEYRAKRDFTRSPEPPGAARPRQRATRFFCVQKHLASHLHYDFRIEHDGVLLSWAVPKGPSIDPTVKRLAMHVEDHPIEYGTFEGVIPEGYGAGIVMLWDQGTWEPEVSDVGAALRRGDLKLRLDGVKLKGSWALVRTRQAGERSWLLIKHRDEWAGPIDIAEFARLSVKSNGDFADILAADNPAIWMSHRPAKTGEAGAMFAKIIERALQMRAAATSTLETPPAREARSGAKKTGAKTAGAKTAGAKTTEAKKSGATGKAAGAKKTGAAREAAGSARRPRR